MGGLITRMSSLPVTSTLSSEDSFEVNRAIIECEGPKQMVYSWFQRRSRCFGSQSQGWCFGEQLGDWKKQFGLLNKVVDHDPQHLEVQVKLGRMPLAAGRLDQALAPSDTDTMKLDAVTPLCNIGIFRLCECGDVASNLRETLRVFQHMGENLSLVLLSFRWSARRGSIAKLIQGVIMETRVHCEWVCETFICSPVCCWHQESCQCDAYD
ncbi:tetratricopeptide repeat protein [Pseudomonas fluorescens]|uniref:Uncharacterized protein n=1 Tax=Pseudomonas fluorescens TaxID=294 RepID=A0A5E7C5B2_PSEFL|nr:tetratricopeptide repeat protein [Pseudomonas fluorescens]VVN99465.1 hypothetical protein PS691_02511 [Pseudomonas fluorescens]